MTESNMAVVIGPNILWSRDTAVSFASISNVNVFSRFLLEHFEALFGTDAVPSNMQAVAAAPAAATPAPVEEQKEADREEATTETAMDSDRPTETEPESMSGELSVSAEESALLHGAAHSSTRSRPASTNDH